ncbi:hypothetical protein LTR85_008708 [Meristemomyces frigidus]|nr:hypothetical protein LTR85_008708 [Meristemomyces frigidus]
MDRSAIGRLPAELRNRIYELALFIPGGIRLDLGDEYPSMARELQEQQLLALTQTCRQLRAESRQIFYAGNVFVVDCDVEYLSDPSSAGMYSLWWREVSEAWTRWLPNMYTWLRSVDTQDLAGLVKLDICTGTMNLDCSPTAEQALQDATKRIVKLCAGHNVQTSMHLILRSTALDSERSNELKLALPLHDAPLCRQRIDQVMAHEHEKVERRVASLSHRPAWQSTFDLARTQLQDCSDALAEVARIIETPGETS